MSTAPDQRYPARIGIGDGPMMPCRFVGMDFAPGNAIASGVREPDGTLRLDHVSLPAPPADIEITLEIDDSALLAALRGSELAAAAVAEAMSDLAEPLDEMHAAARYMLERARQGARARTQSIALHPQEEPAAEQIVDSDLNWEAQSAVCCHVCGPDPDHSCDARAVTTLRHPLPSGGHRDLPLCRPCEAAESAENPHAALTPVGDTPTALTDPRARLAGEWIDAASPARPVERLFVVAATSTQFTEWCHDQRISPRDRRVVRVTGQPGQLEGHDRGLRYLVLAYPPGGRALTVINGLVSRDAVPFSDSEFAAWRTSVAHRDTVRLGGYPVTLAVDPHMPPGTLEARSGESVARVTNIGSDDA